MQTIHKSSIATAQAVTYAWGMSTKQEAGRRLKAAREALGLTLKEVCAGLAGIEVSRLSNWEQGLNMIPVDEAKRLALVLHTSAAYLLTLDDDFDPRTEAMAKVYKQLGEAAKDRIFRAAEVESEYVTGISHEAKRQA